MKLYFNINFEDKVLSGRSYYSKQDLVIRNYFYLNKDFTVKKLTVDGKQLDINYETVKIMNGYEVNKYVIPEITNDILVEYSGVLDGTTGVWPYVKETITKEFALIRFESFCYPMFFDSLTSLFNEFNNNKAIVTINVPKDYTICTPGKYIKEKEINSRKEVKYNTNSITFAVGKFQTLEIFSGTFYSINDISENVKHIERTLRKTESFMINKYGDVHLKNNNVYVVIPDGLGSFVLNNYLYITEDNIKCKNQINAVIHEYIHLGWNPMVDPIDQRIRFFDEGITQYFLLRFLRDYDNESYYNEINNYKQTYKKYLEQDSKYFVPLCDFGKLEYGTLSYYIGPLILLEIEKKVGSNKFDGLIKYILRNYKTKPINLSLFYQELIKPVPEVKEYIRELLYTTIHYKNIIE